MDSKQIASLLKTVSFSQMSPADVDGIVLNFTDRFDTNAQIEILASIPATVQSVARIARLIELSKSPDLHVAAKSKQLLNSTMHEQGIAAAPL